MRRVWTDVSNWRAPFDELPFAGLGLEPPRPPWWRQQWPRGRAYYDVSNFRAPYDEGYYQDNTLNGLGADAAAAVSAGIAAAQVAAIKRERLTTNLKIAGVAGVAILGVVVITWLTGPAPRTTSG